MTESAVTAQATSGLTPNVAGTGTTDFIPLWTSSTGKLGNSVMFQSGTGSTATVGINTTTPAQKLEVDLGNLLVKGTGNFKAAGDTAYAYVGDKMCIRDRDMLGGGEGGGQCSVALWEWLGRATW